MALPEANSIEVGLAEHGVTDIDPYANAYSSSE